MTETYSYTDLKLEKKSIISSSMICTYIALDKEERKTVAQGKHEYLIEQVQVDENNNLFGDKNIRLSFNHPVKELIWVLQRDEAVRQGEFFNYTSKLNYNQGQTEHLLKEARLLLNGNEHTPWFDYLYYYFVQNFETHSNYAVHLFYMFSFALKPQIQTPTGTCNFSRLDNPQLQIKVNQNYLNQSNRGQMRIYAIGYNVLRIQSGMAGLAFSN